MKIKEAAEVFKNLGWKPKLNVDRYAEKDLGDRIIDVGFKIRDTTIGQTLSTNRSIKIAEFTAAVKEVCGGGKDFNEMFKNDFWYDGDLRVPVILPQHIETICNQAIEWARTIDIDQRYQELANLPPATHGAGGSWHLAALAVLGDVAKLKGYQSRFAEGDTCGFVRYITKEYIDRAVVLAERNAHR